MPPVKNVREKRPASARRTKPKGPESTTPDLVVLALLAERPMHGYELNRELERREVRDWAGISRPQVYYSLHKLKRARLIEPAGPRSRKGSIKRQVFSLTEAGRGALSDALERPSWATQRIPPPFLTWLALSPHARAGVASRQLQRRREFLLAEVEKERATLAAIRKDSGPMVQVAALMVDLTIRHMEVELDWLGD